MNKHPRHALTLAAALTVAAVMTGCESAPTTYSQDKAAAHSRFNTTRTTMAIQMAERQFDNQDLDSATKTLLDAMKINAKDGRVYLMLGRIALERGQLERAFDHFEMALDFDDKLHGAHYFRGVVLQRWQQFEKALTEYTKAYESQRDKPSYLLAMAEMMIEMDRVDESLSLLKSKLVYFDQNAGIRMAIGQIYLLKNDPKGAARYYKQAALLAPDDLKIREELAAVQIRSGATSKAIRHLESLIGEEDYTKRSDLRFQLGSAYLAERRPHDAKKVFTDLTKSQPNHVESWIKYGESSWATGDTVSTLRAAGKVRELDPRRHEGYLMAGMVWHKRGRIDEAIRMFDTAAEVAPRNNLPVILRGITLEQAGRSAAAAAAYREALRRKPDDQRAKRLLSAVMSKAN